jgi:hypothetical protein
MAGKKSSEKGYSPNWGGARQGGGRKMLYTGGRQQLAISCSSAQKEAVKRAAEENGQTVAEYVMQRLGVADLK